MIEQEKREKVIKGIEHHMRGECGGCPYCRGWHACEAVSENGLFTDTLALLKAQEPETLDAQKSDNNIGCWYDITHNYTLEQVVSALKSRELCEDAVSRKYLLGQSYSIKFQTIDESDEEAYREKVVCVEDIEDAPSVQPVPMARVMTLEELIGIYNLREDHSWVYDTPPYLYLDNRAWIGYWVSWSNIVGCLEGQEVGYKVEKYGEIWRCWTSRPDEKRRAETPWN